MNIIVPLGGVGSRFASEGYVRPKPLIRVLGKEMIFWVLDSLTINPEDQVRWRTILMCIYQMCVSADANPYVKATTTCCPGGCGFEQIIIVYLPEFLGRDFERIVLEKYPEVSIFGVVIRLSLRLSGFCLVVTPVVIARPPQISLCRRSLLRSIVRDYSGFDAVATSLHLTIAFVSNMRLYEERS